MPYLEEIKLTLYFIAIVTAYKVLLQPRLRVRKKKLLERYLTLQSLSLKMQDLILNHVLKYDAMNDELFNGITFKTYLRDLQRKHAAYLSDTYYKKAKRQNVIFFYLKISRILKEQEERLQNVKQDLMILDEASHKADVKKVTIS